MPDDYLERLFDLPSRMLVGDIAIMNVLDCIRSNQNEDREIALYECRFAVRAVGAILPVGADDALTVARATGFTDVRANEFFSAIAALGPYTGEMGVEKLRGFLTQIVIVGEHPAVLADAINLDQEEYDELNHLLELEEHWMNTVDDRVLAAVAEGAGLAEIRRLARCGRLQARRWRRWATRTLAALDLDALLEGSTPLDP